MDEAEIDATMTLIAEAQFERMAVGAPCLDKDGKRFTVIGMEMSDLNMERNSRYRNDDIRKIKPNFEWYDGYFQIIGLSYDALSPEQQEIMTVNDPSKVRTLIDLDPDQELEGAR